MSSSPVRSIAHLAGNEGELMGVSLRVNDSTPRWRLTGTRGWTPLSHPFQVRRGIQSTVELICELDSEGGEAWFDKQSLLVVRE